MWGIALCANKNHNENELIHMQFGVDPTADRLRQKSWISIEQEAPVNCIIEIFNGRRAVTGEPIGSTARRLRSAHAPPRS